MHALPDAGFLRLRQIIGDPKADPPIPALIPVSKSTFWQGVKDQRYPQPTRSLGRRITAWSVADIRAFLDGALPPANDASPSSEPENVTRVCRARPKP